MAAGTVSVRMLWPFMRVLRGFGLQLEILRGAGLDESVLSDADARIPREILGRMLWASIQSTGDVALGVHAGERAESSDFGVMDHAVRASPDMRRALACIARYTRLQDDAVEPRIIEQGDGVTFEMRSSIPTVLRATNDFQVTCAVTNFHRRLRWPEPPLEVHLRHDSPTNVEEYERVFRAPVRLGMPHNAVVYGRGLLAWPIATANPDVCSAFGQRLEAELRELDRVETIAQRVRRLLLERMGRDGIGIADIGGELHMSPATLRRRLVDEGTTYRSIVDELRRELALRYVAEPRVAIGEVAFLLGFSTQSAFGTAFRRWTGSSPLEHRLRLKAARAPH